VSNQSQVKKLYVINLETFTLQGFLNISGKYSKSQAPVHPDWVITIAVLGSFFIIFLLITATWFCLRYKKRNKVDKNNNSEQEMQEVWASAAHESDGLTSRAATFSNSNTGSTVGLNDLTLINGSMINYDCFKHEVDLEDLEIIKTKALDY
jgi:cbb3-type cytochrome oxidase subunit 3